MDVDGADQQQAGDAGSVAAVEDAGEDPPLRTSLLGTRVVGLVMTRYPRR